MRERERKRERQRRAGFRKGGVDRCDAMRENFLSLGRGKRRGRGRGKTDEGGGERMSEGERRDG